MVAGLGVGGVLVATVQLDDSPEQLAVTFLSFEVPRWPVENGCYSCHNNGDAARALYTAVGMAMPVELQALRDTTDWVQQPETWDDNALGHAFSDQVLARIQFAGALVTAIDAGLVDDLGPLHLAAELIAGDQKEDGSWRLDAGGSIGSPATYGTALATWAALRALKRTSSNEVASAIARGERWLREIEVKTVLDAAAVVLALGPATDRPASRQRAACLDIIVRGRAPSGGWGAYLTTPTEPFDTAVVILALTGLIEESAPPTPGLDRVDLEQLVAGGRRFLLAEQLEDGSWIETTRPPGQQSYAQYISTTGWATLALLATINPD